MKSKKALISFVGTNDRGDDQKKGEGAILAVFDERKFDKAFLLWVNTKKQKIDFYDIAENVRHKLQGRKLCKEVELIQFDCKNVVDHNEIYQSLLDVCNELPTDYEYTAAISSGTPQMHVCWLLLAESGDFKIKLIKSVEKNYGGKRVEPVQLNSTLPRIISLRNEVEEKEKEIQELIPNLTIDVNKRSIKIGETDIILAPAEFAHYCVLAKHASNGDEAFLIKGHILPRTMAIEALDYYQQTAEHLYENLTQKEKDEKLKYLVDVKTWRAFISRINKKIENSQLNFNIIKHYKVSDDGSRNSKLYFCLLYTSPSPRDS